MGAPGPPREVEGAACQSGVSGRAERTSGEREGRQHFSRTLAEANAVPIPLAVPCNRERTGGQPQSRQAQGTNAQAATAPVSTRLGPGHKGAPATPGSSVSTATWQPPASRGWASQALRLPLPHLLIMTLWPGTGYKPLCCPSCLASLLCKTGRVPLR